MQTNEEASRLRANAASLIIRNQLDLKQTLWIFSNFKIQSTTPEGLADNEFRELVSIYKRVKELLEQVVSTVSTTSSAIAASIYPSNSAAKLTAIINSIDIENKLMGEVEQQFQQFNDSSDDVNVRRSIIIFVQDKINKALTEITSNTLNQLHLLLFGDGQP
jgi:hypothetical protein